MNNIFRYIGYAAVSILIGWISSLYPSIDYIGKIETSIVPILLSLLVLYTTLSSLLVKEILKYKSSHENNQEINIAPTISSLKRNVIIELAILCITFVSLSCKGILLNALSDYTWIVNTFTNSLTVFSVLYFILVIYDSFAGLFDILIENSK